MRSRLISQARIRLRAFRFLWRSSQPSPLAPEGPPLLQALRGGRFGSARASGNLGRVTRPLLCVCGELFLAIACVYGDDDGVAEPDAAADGAHEVFSRLFGFRGFGLSEAKGQTPATAVHMLGADVARDSDQLRASLPERKKRDGVYDIRHVISRNQLNPGHSAAKFRGKMVFFQSLLFGELGRARLHPLAHRRYSKKPRRPRPLSEELAGASPPVGWLRSGALRRASLPTGW